MLSMSDAEPPNFGSYPFTSTAFYKTQHLLDVVDGSLGVACKVYPSSLCDHTEINKERRWSIGLAMVSPYFLHVAFYQ